MFGRLHIEMAAYNYKTLCILVGGALFQAVVATDGAADSFLKACH